LTTLCDACDLDPHLFPENDCGSASHWTAQPAIQSNLRRIASAFASSATARRRPAAPDEERERQATLRALSDALYRCWTLATRPRACALCAEERPAGRFGRATARCAHPPRACAACLRRWAGAQVEGGAWGRLRCPECDEGMKREDVKAVAGRETYERFVFPPFFFLELGPV
jgi:hypothetical protein